MFTISWRQEKPSGISLGRHTHTIHTHVPAGVVIWELYERVWCTKFQSSGIFTSVSVGSSPRSYLFTSAKVRMVFTPKYDTKPVRYVTLLRDRRGAVSLRHRNRAEITVLVCEQKTYPVWLSWRRKSNPVWCELVCYTAVFRVVTQRSSPLGKRLCSRLGVNMTLGKFYRQRIWLLQAVFACSLIIKW